MDFIAGIGAITNAINIAKALREIDKDYDAAALKMQLADLSSALADAKMALTDADEENKKAIFGSCPPPQSGYRHFQAEMDRRIPISIGSIRFASVLASLSVVSEQGKNHRPDGWRRLWESSKMPPLPHAIRSGSFVFVVWAFQIA